MEYTRIPVGFEEEYNELNKKRKAIRTKEFKWKKWQSLFLWSKYQLGVILRIYECYCIHKILTAPNKKIAICWARQLGKSITLGIFCLWATWFNIFPATVENITTAFLMSRDDDTAKELLGKIRGILKKGNIWMAKVLKNKDTYTEDYFSSQIVPPDNEHQLTFKNGCFIKSIPPTDTVLGKSASIFCQDEDAKLKIRPPLTDYTLHYEVVKPTMAETDGIWIRSSTPNGESGDFYDIFDPYNKSSIHEFERIWFNYKIYTNQKWLDRMKNEENVAKEKGPMAYKLWQQEHMALFTVTVDSFFEMDDIEKGTDKDAAFYHEWDKSPCSLGIDYGIKRARTVITVRTEYEKKCIQLYQKRFPPNFDINQLTDPNFYDSIPNLKERYTLSHIVPDDCAQGDMINRWMKNKGYPIISNSKEGIGFNFRSDQSMERKRGFYLYRSKIKSDFIKYPASNTVQITEMKMLQETQLKINVSIKAPEGELCDTVDSDMMAAYPFIHGNKSFSSILVEYNKIEEDIKKEWSDPRYDRQWELLKIKDGDK